MCSPGVPAASIVCTAADLAQMGLPSIYIASSDEDNDMFISSSPDTDDLLEEHISNKSDNAGEGLSFHPHKCKSAPKMKVKGKGHTTSASATKKQTAAAVKLKLKVAPKSKTKSKVKSVK